MKDLNSCLNATVISKAARPKHSNPAIAITSGSSGSLSFWKDVPGSTDSLAPKAMINFTDQTFFMGNEVRQETANFNQINSPKQPETTMLEGPRNPALATLTEYENTEQQVTTPKETERWKGSTLSKQNLVLKDSIVVSSELNQVLANFGCHSEPLQPCA